MYKEQISAYFDDPARRAELVAAVSRLVGVKSVREAPVPGAPFGPGPRAALDEALKLCSELGFATRDYDHYVGLADLNDKPTQLHLLGHLKELFRGNPAGFALVHRGGQLGEELGLPGGLGVDLQLPGHRFECYVHEQQPSPGVQGGLRQPPRHREHPAGQPGKGEHFGVQGD